MGDKMASNVVGVPDSSTSSGGGEKYRQATMIVGDEMYPAMAKVRVSSRAGWGWGWGGGGGGVDGDDNRGGVDGTRSERGQDEDVNAGVFGTTNGAGGERGQKSRRSARFEGLHRRWKRWGEVFNEAIDGPWV